MPSFKDRIVLLLGHLKCLIPAEVTVWIHVLTLQQDGSLLS